MKSGPKSLSHLTRRQQQWLAKYGPWAVVTGASEGIGREMASCLAEAGLNLLLVARRQSVLDEIADDLTKRYDIETRIISADLAKHDDVERVIDSTDTLNIGVLVACAGFGTSGRLINSSLEQELNMLDVNCRAVLALSHAFGRRFAKQQRGGIVLMSSLLAFQGVPRAANYAATKAYVQTLGEGLRLELAPSNIDVLVSAPGPVKSGFADRADMRMSMALGPKVVARETLDALGRKTTVRPGWLSKLLEGSFTGLPRGARAWILGQVMKGMTKHQPEQTE